MTRLPKEFVKYLTPTAFIDSDHPRVVDYARAAIGNAASDTDKAIRLFYAVRDDIYYDPYSVDVRPGRLTASATLAAKRGFCIPKAILLAAVSRTVGVPSRLGFADVKNHLTTEKLRAAMGTDIFVYHGYVEFFLNGRWVKATPAFNRSLCEKFHIKPLDFDGQNDSLFHEFDEKGNKHMEYIRDHGQYADVPLKDIISSFRKHYPRLRTQPAFDVPGDFEADAQPL